MESHQIEENVPIIDFSDDTLKPGSDSWLSASKQVRSALETYGCFEAVFTRKISSELHNSIFSSAKELFDLPTETKMIKTSDRPGCGYAGQIPIIPLYESLEVDNPTTPKEVERFANAMWPSGSNNYSFSETVRSFTKPAMELYETATRLVLESYGLGKHYESLMEKTYYGLRFFKFRTRNESESEIGVPTHTDKTFISLLYQNHIGGLNIRTEDDRFISVEPKFSSFVFLAGDALTAWTNGRVRACEHQVVMKEQSPARISVGLFSFVNDVMHVPQELVDDEHPLRYEPFDHFGFLSFYFLKGGTQYECPIKAYCGVPES